MRICRSYSFSGLTGTINQTAWDKKENGLVTIRFYVNDSVGRLEFADRNIMKDDIAPVIIINSPTSNQICGLEPPTFNLTIEEVNIHEKWYSFNGGDNITFTTETQFNSSEWDKIGDGLVVVRFYVSDKAGNMNTSEVIIRKVTNRGTPMEYNLLLMIGVIIVISVSLIGFISIIFLKKRKNSIIL